MSDETRDQGTDEVVDAVAIVGMAGRFPGARDLDAFWHNLRTGVESVSFFSDEELIAAGIDPSILDLPDHVKAGAIVDDIDQFDAAFFGINPREAETIDPQHRVFLECSWEALENAGYDPQHSGGTTAVFGGCSLSTYHLQGALLDRDQVESMGSSQVNAGSATDFLAMRVSYLLNLTGPSITLHTACSTSMIAVVQAWQALMSYQCDMALAGGVTVRVPQKNCYNVVKEAILAPDGHCRPFDADASGTASGEGVGVVVLKRLEDALADGDHIRAVIRGVGSNNEGYNKVSIYAPSVGGQAEVIAMAQSLADVDPGTITYVEAHGTGTSLGDPIEVAALTQAFREGTDRRGYCALGSVKSNIGHAEAAAGVAGLIKTVLALEHRELPPSLNFAAPNPQIDFEGSPFFVNAELRAWDGGGAPLRAGVSSFGLGGTNAHVVVEEAPAPRPVPPARHGHLLVLSAKSGAALEAATDRLAAWLRTHPAADLADVEYTLQVGRGLFGHRRAVVCRGIEDAVLALESRDTARVATGATDVAGRPVAFMFPGQGAQHVGMGRELYETEAVFRREVDSCCDMLAPHLDGMDLREVLYPDAAQAESAAEQLGQTRLTQPALFVIEYALAKLWMAWGVEPTALIGHSVGEYVAACLAGVISLPDALRLVAARGRMMQELPAGDMMSVALPEAELVPLLGGEVSLAAVNGPASCVVSGPAAAVAELQHKLAGREVACRLLHTSHAFHSSMMDAIVEPFLALVREIELAPAALPCTSTVTGRAIEPADWARPESWADNLRQPVRFADGASALLAESDRILLEVGPGRTLSTLVRQQGAAASDRAVIASMRHPQDSQSDLDVVLAALGRLWIAGASVDWTAFDGGARRRVPLPTYPFERKRFWLEARKTAASGGLRKRADVGDWFYAPSWQRTLLEDAGSVPDPAPRWLLFVDAAGLGECVAARLPGAVTVTVGDAYRKVDAQRYELRPGERADYDALLDDLQVQGLPSRVMHLWSVIDPEAPAADLAAVADAQDRGFYSLLFLVQALGERLGSADARIEVVSNDLFEVTGREATHPERATILGPARVAPHEFENIDCVHVDVQLPANGAGSDEVVGQLLAESASTSADAVVAYRGPHRWVPGYQHRRLPSVPPDVGWRRDGGTYLITGGLGGIGLVLAGELAKTGAGTKLVLVGRSGLEGDDERTARRRAAVEALRDRGAEVLVLRGDAADPAQMRDVVKRAIAECGPIHGVVHAAGLSTGGMMALRTRAAAAEVLDPKVQGTLVLRDLLRDQPLDFFVLCSSLASVIAGVGAADYCGANAFLDALVHSGDLGRDIPFVSLNWDTWAEVGMAAETAVSDAMRRERAAHLAMGIRPVEGADAFARVLSSGLRQAYVSTRDLPELLAGAVRTNVQDYDEPAEVEGAAPESTSSLHERPDLATPYTAPESDIEVAIAGIVSELLAIERVGVHDNLFELGFDSLISHMMISRIKKLYQVEPPLRTVLETPTVSELARYVEAAQWAASQMLDRG